MENLTGHQQIRAIVLKLAGEKYIHSKKEMFEIEPVEDIDLNIEVKVKPTKRNYFKFCGTRFNEQTAQILISIILMEKAYF